MIREFIITKVTNEEVGNTEILVHIGTCPWGDIYYVGNGRLALNTDAAHTHWPIIKVKESDS